MPAAETEVMTLIDNGLEILSSEECHELLRQSTVGRVAVTVAALPAIFPVNYAVLDGRIVFRTGEGTKLQAAVERAVVAFQVDHIDKSGGPSSSPDAASPDQARFTLGRISSVLRRRVPGADR